MHSVSLRGELLNSEKPFSFKNCFVFLGDLLPFFARRRVPPLTIAYFQLLENKKASCYQFGLKYLYDRGI